MRLAAQESDDHIAGLGYKGLALLATYLAAQTLGLADVADHFVRGLFHVEYDRPAPWFEPAIIVALVFAGTASFMVIARLRKASESTRDS